MLKLCLLSLTLTGGNLSLRAEATGSAVENLEAQSPQQQQRERLLRGTVTDKDGQPLPGVAVQVKGTTQGVATNVDGEYYIMIKGVENPVLIFSFIGMETQEVAFQRGKHVINVKMQESQQALEEVVVNGIFTRKTESFTGSATTFNQKELKRIGNSNVLQSLKTLDPSFNLMDNNTMGSNPNQTLQIEVRGKTNVAGLTDEYANDPNQPLFILDGFESTLQTISDLSMDRVQSITILKDAAATAIYGSKAANGVVVVETKAPEAGKLRVNYNGNLNLSWADLTDYNLMNASEKLEYELKSGVYGILDPELGTPILPDDARLYFQRAAEIARGVDTDWLNEPLRFAITHRHNLYIEGGDETFRYGVGANMGKTEGVMKGSDRQTANGNIRLIYRTGQFAFTNNMNFDYTKADQEKVAFSEFANANPYMRKYVEEGSVIQLLGYDWYGTPVYSPMADYSNNNINTTRTTGFTNNFEAEWRPMQQLRARVKFGLQNNNSRSKVFKSPFNVEYIEAASEERGSYRENTSTSWNYDGDFSLSYGDVLAEKHQINAIIGARLTESSTESSAFRLKGFTDDDVVSALFAHAYDISSRNTDNTKRRSASYYLSANYAYDNRYLLDLSWRKDGSSVFGLNEHFTDTWSAGLGWNIHNEAFMKEQSIIDYLKIRASIGNPGNQNFSDYISVKIFSYDTAYPTPWGSSILISSYGNNNLKWQKTIDANLGLDLYLLDSRLRLNFDIFRKNTDPLLATMSLPLSAGDSGKPFNIGSLLTTGYTLQANYQIIKKHDLIWSINGNLRHLKSEYRDIGNAFEGYNQENQSKDMFRYYDGASPTALWTVRSAGIDPATGKEMFYKLDGTTTYEYSYDDEVVVGNTEPDFEGVFGTSFYYKGFSASINFRYRVGGQDFMEALYEKVENIPYEDVLYNQDRRALYDRWQQPGDHTFFKGIDVWEETPMSSRFVRDNNLLRCESISLGYETTAPWLKTFGASSMTVRAYMNDLFNISSIKEERGTSYPFARSVSFSLGLRF
ncbi:MAG: SusC/RagA family TonB-linked outer membrane protein [Bacteroides sp.]|nr:SusC/RagA family TonB-linked outer membrane protein [Bacteroides sp.]